MLADENHIYIPGAAESNLQHAVIGTKCVYLLNDVSHTLISYSLSKFNFSSKEKK